MLWKNHFHKALIEIISEGEQTLCLSPHKMVHHWNFIGIDFIRNKQIIPNVIAVDWTNNIWSMANQTKPMFFYISIHIAELNTMVSKQKYLFEFAFTFQSDRKGVVRVFFRFPFEILWGCQQKSQTKKPFSNLS